MAANSGSFQVANFAALKHGSRSPRVQRSKQQEIRSRVRRELKTKSRAWLDRLILAYEARVQSYHEYLDGVGGPVDSRGKTRRCLDHCQKDEATLIRLYAIRENRPEPMSELAAHLDSVMRRREEP